MKAARFHEVNRFICEDVPDLSPKKDEILLEVAACGICGSDIPRVFSLGTKVAPVTLGHEFCGIIRAVGNPKDNDLIGKRAAVFNIKPCMECRYCRHGDYAHCENISYLGTRIDGGFAEYCIVPSRFQLVLTDGENTPIEWLSLTEPAAVALHAIRRAHPEPGNSMLIIGAGPIGILTARWAQLLGIQDVMLTDIAQEKVDFAVERGLVTWNCAKEDLPARILEKTGKAGADIVIEGSGSTSGINMAVECLATFGKIILLGNAHGDVTIKLDSFSNIQRKEATLIACWNSYYCDEPLNEWHYAVKMIEEEKLRVDDLITHRSDLEQLPELFRKINDREVSVCKAIYDAQLSI